MEFEHRANHDGYNKKYHLVDNHKAYTLRPLTSQQVYKEQIKTRERMLKEESVLKKPIESEKQEKSEKEKGKEIESNKNMRE